MPTPLVLKIEVDDRGKINVDKVTGSFDRLKDATKKADKQTKVFSHTMGTIKGVLGGVTGAVFSLKGALAALGLGLLAKNALNVASEFESIKVALDTITKGKGVETFEALNQWAKVMPINTQKAIDAFKTMLAMGLKPTIKDMTTLVDTTAAFGGSPEVMERVAFALGKIEAKGKASARELLTFSQVGIPIVKILREELNDTSIAFDNMGNSSYTSSQVISAVLRGLEKRYGGLSERITYTWAGLMEFFESEWADFVRIVFESGLFDYLRGHLITLRERIEGWAASGKIKEWAKSTSDAIINGFKKIEDGIRFVIDHIDDLKKAFNLLLFPVKAFIAFKLAAILTEIGSEAIFAVKHLVHMKTTMIALNSATKGMSAGTKGGMIGLALFGGWEIGKWLNQFDIVKKWGIALAAGLHKTFLWLEKSLKGTWDLIKFAFDKMIQGIEITLNNLPESIQFVLNSIIDGINKMLASMSKLPIIGEKIQGAKLGKIEFGTIKLKEDYMTFEKVLQNLLKYESDYEKAVKDAKEIWQEMFDEVGKVEESINKVTKATKEGAKEVPKVELPKFFEGAEEEITEFSKNWDAMWKDMTEGFVGEWANMLSGSTRNFEDFMENLGNIFKKEAADMVAETFIRPGIEALMGDMKKQLTSFGASIFGKGGAGAGGGLVGGTGEGFLSSPYLSAAAMGAGYGYGQAGTGGAFMGAIGGMAGYAFGGPVGGMLGSFIGGKLMKSLEDEPAPKIPEIGLVYEVIGGELEKVSEDWKNIGRSQDLLNKIESIFQTQIDFYQQVADFSQTTLEDFSIQLSAISEVAIRTLEANAASVGVGLGLQFYEELSNLMKGGDITAEMTSFFKDMYGKFMDTLFSEQVSELLEAGAPTGRYDGDYFHRETFQPIYEQVQRLQDILDLPAEQRKEEYLDIIRDIQAIQEKYWPTSYTQMERDFDELIERLNSEWGVITTDISSVLTDFSVEFTKTIGDAFLSSLETGQFSSFLQKLKEGLYGSFREALFKGFFEETMQKVLADMWGQFGVTGWGEMVDKVLAGETFEPVEMIESLTSTLEQVEPVYNTMIEAMGTMEAALGLNTEAVVSNNDLLEKQQMVEDFISELTTGALAPVQSYEAIMGRYQDLLASDNLQELFNFVTGTALPFLQTYGGNYQEAFSGVIEDLRNLSGLYGANISPSAIGEAVAGAIMPALQGGSQTIHVTVEVDGQALGEVILDQLQTNPQLVQEVKEITQ